MEMKTPFASPVKAYSIEYHVIGEDGQLVLDNRTTWKYNADHQIVEIDQQNSNKYYSEKTIYSYDENLKLQEMVVKVAEGEVKRRLVYEYEDDLLTQVTEVAGDYKIVTKYDDQGNPAEKSTYTRSDYLVSNTVFVNLYDQNGRLVEMFAPLTVLPVGTGYQRTAFPGNLIPASRFNTVSICLRISIRAARAISRASATVSLLIARSFRSSWIIRNTRVAMLALTMASCFSRRPKSYPMPKHTNTASRPNVAVTGICSSWR